MFLLNGEKNDEMIPFGEKNISISTFKHLRIVCWRVC